MAPHLPSRDPSWVADPPPRQAPGAALLVSPPAGQPPLRLLLLTDEWEGANVHWTGARSVPCLSPMLPCPGCQRGYPKTWNGYMPAIRIGQRARSVWVLSWTAVTELRRLAEAQGRLRGLRVTVSRLLDRKTSKVVVTYTGSEKPDAVPETDLGWVRDVMRRVWDTAEANAPADMPGEREV